MNRLRLLLLALIILPSLRALTVRPPTFNELVGTADAIVIGEITSVESTLRTVAGRPVPFTHVTIAVTETLKGPATKTVVLQCLGGTVGGESLHVVGAPEFAVGDRGFFFVQNNGTQFLPLVGITHGLYRNIRDEHSGTEFVTRSNGEPLRLATEVSASLARVAGAPTVSLASALTPAEFARQIKVEVGHAAQ